MVSGKAFIDALTSRGRRGLRWEILVSLGLIMLSGVLFMGATALKAAEKTILVQKLESLTQVTRSLQMGLAGWWGIGEPPGEIQALMGPTAAALGINGFKVTDTEGRLLASLRTQEMGTVTADPFLLKALATGSLVVPGEVAGKAPEAPRGSWTFAAPVFRDGVLIGAFSVSYPLENLDVVLRLHRKIVFTFALLDGIFIVLFGGWLIGRVAVRPIVRISRGAEALASGDYDTRVAVQGPKEVEALAASFNEMAAKIQEEVRKQEEHLKALERTNQELKATQREMVRVEKMVSVGHLSAGVAHEIGNPLAAIMGYASILLREEKDPEILGYLDRIVGETQRIQRIISGLLEFSRPRETRVQELDVNDLVTDTVDLVNPQGIFRHVKVRVAVSQASPVVSGDRHQLQQALVNIMLNAAQAMGGRGDLSVSTGTRVLAAETGHTPRRRATDGKDEDYSALRATALGLPVLREGEKVVTIVIRDSGPGIPPEVLERIFDPFFTTKGIGEGTGLGLSIAYGIVEAHGGRLWAGNAEGGGAQFTMVLPEGGAARGAYAGTGESEERRGGGEDEG